jgi:hypothetical protein
MLLFTKYMWKTITFHCLPSLRWRAEKKKQKKKKNERKKSHQREKKIGKGSRE